MVLAGSGALLMANRKLTITQLANVALEAGLGVGFNAARADLRYSIASDNSTIDVFFGDHRTLRTSRTAAESAVAYATDSECKREPILLSLPEWILAEDLDKIRTALTQPWLELAQP